MIKKSKQGKTDKLLEEIGESFHINDNSIAAKMKRLKIEESHLLKTLNSTIFTNMHDDNTNDNPTSGYKNLISKLKDLYENMTIVFGDIQGCTSSEEAIRSTGKYNVFRISTLYT